MAQSLVWHDLSSAQLESLRTVNRSGTPRSLLAKLAGIQEPQSPKGAILLDLYVHTLQFGQELGLADDKLSALFSLIKEVHRRSTEDRMALEPSFCMFKDLLLAHSVHRPPFSIGLFTHAEFKRILAWALDSYYRHYKLYQYAYTDRVVMSVTQHHPLDVIELAPEGLLLPLDVALTDAQHRDIQTEHARKLEEALAAAATQQAEEDEARRIALLREGYEAAVPDEIKERVTAAVDKELAALHEAMEARFVKQHQATIAALVADGKLPPPPPEAPPTKAAAKGG